MTTVLFSVLVLCVPIMAVCLIGEILTGDLA